MRRTLLIVLITLGSVLFGALGANAATNLTTTNVTYAKFCDSSGLFCAVE